jgi:hypothetical protein
MGQFAVHFSAKMGCGGRSPMPGTGRRSGVGHSREVMDLNSPDRFPGLHLWSTDGRFAPRIERCQCESESESESVAESFFWCGCLLPRLPPVVQASTAAWNLLSWESRPGYICIKPHSFVPAFWSRDLLQDDHVNTDFYSLPDVCFQWVHMSTIVPVPMSRIYLSYCFDWKGARYWPHDSTLNKTSHKAFTLIAQASLWRV